MSLSSSWQHNVTDVIPEDYFSLDQILAEQQKVSSQLKKSMFSLGYLDPSNQSEHLVNGSKLEVPLWLAVQLSNKNYLDCELPKPYQEAARNILLADSSVVDLFKQVVYYYKTGIKLTKIPHPESPHVAVSLVRTFVGRFKTLMYSSSNCKNKDISALCVKLDMDEKELFEINRAAVIALENWEQREGNTIQPSALVLHRRKRKRDQVF